MQRLDIFFFILRDGTSGKTKESSNAASKYEAHHRFGFLLFLKFGVVYSSSTDTIPSRLPTSVSSFSTPQLRGRRSEKDSAGVMLTVFCRARNLDVQHFNIAAAVELKHIIQTVLVLVFHIQIDLRHIFEHAVLDTREHKLGEHDEHGRENAALVEAAAKGEADDGRGPEPGGRGQAL